MTMPFRKDEQVTVEQKTRVQDPDFGGDIDAWEVVADHIWANTQDLLPSRGESTTNGLTTSVARTRLRIDIDERIAADMRVKLHGKGDRIMQIVAGPALLDDRRHMEFMLESFTS